MINQWVYQYHQVHRYITPETKDECQYISNILCVDPPRRGTTVRAEYPHILRTGGVVLVSTGSKYGIIDSIVVNEMMIRDQPLRRKYRYYCWGSKDELKERFGVGELDTESFVEFDLNDNITGILTTEEIWKLCHPN